jgi:hypothetical protein
MIAESEDGSEDNRGDSRMKQNKDERERDGGRKMSGMKSELVVLGGGKSSKTRRDADVLQGTAPERCDWPAPWAIRDRLPGRAGTPMVGQAVLLFY